MSKARAPHGSALREIFRQLVIRFLPKPCRSWIKLQLYGLKKGLFRGRFLAQQVDAIRDEMDRLKSQNILLESRLNLVLYGFPRVDPYRAELISSPLLGHLPSRARIEALVVRLNEEPLVREKAQYRAFADDFPTSCKHVFISGLPPQSLALCWMERGGHAQTVELYDGDPLTRTMGVEQIHRFLPGAGVQEFGSSCLNALLNSASKLDLIFLGTSFTTLSGLEQLHLVYLAAARLRLEGQFSLLLPRIDSEGFWNSPQNLRPYAPSALEAAVRESMDDVRIQECRSFWHLGARLGRACT